MNTLWRYCFLGLIFSVLLFTGCGQHAPVESSDQRTIKDASTQTSSITSLPTAEELKAANLRNLSINVPVANLTIRSGEGYALIIGEKLMDHCLLTLDQQTLTLTHISDDRWWNSEKNIPEEEIIISLTVPRDNATFDQSQLNLGIGTAQIEGLDSKTFLLDAGTAEIELSDIVTETMELTSGVGELNGNDLVATKMLTIKGGVSSSDIRGDFTGAIKIHNGVGELTLHLARPQSAYQMDTAKGLGTVKIGSHSTVTPAEQNEIPSTIDIVMGIGDITLQFTPE